MLRSRLHRFSRAIEIDNVNKNLIKAEYAVRGLIPQRAKEIERQLILDPKQFEFRQLDYCNIGNPQAFNQPPISFFREVLSCVLLGRQGIKESKFDEDIKQRALYYIDNIEGNVGGISSPIGYNFIRKNIKNFIIERDQIQDQDNLYEKTIFMSNGASDMITTVLSGVIQDSHDGVLVPIPQYPLYSALIQMSNCQLVKYHLNEQKGWNIDIAELKEQIVKSIQYNINLKVMCIINPGNPTGQIMSYETIQEMVKLCYDNNILILADEVYQQNIYNPDKQFNSIRKVVLEMPYPYNHTQVVSFHSTSKGFIGECGLRGGYAEFLNFEPSVLNQFRLLKYMSQCSNTAAQVLTDLMIRPPEQRWGESANTIEQYCNERDNILEGMKTKAQIISKYMQSMKNMSCQVIEGAMYAFPQLHFSQKAIDYATEQGYKPDVYYCLQALEKTGIVLVPGSGFKQFPDTYHFRITILINPIERLENSLQRLKEFNDQFHQRFE